MRRVNRSVVVDPGLNMEEPTPTPIAPEAGEPRYCPECGSRVADLATACLMCGASLDVQDIPAPEEPSRPRLQIPWRGLIAGILTAAAFIAGVGWLVKTQIAMSTGTATPSLTFTPTRPPTNTPRPTDTPSPTATASPIPPLAHQVQSGETCIGIAAQYAVPLDLLIALNPEKCGQGATIRPGDILIVPAATPTPGPTLTVGPGTPSPAPQCPIYHVVQLGETGLGIAEQYHISLNEIAAANPDQDLGQLQVNQVLTIPCGTPIPTATPTPDPNATPTPIPKYAAPALLSPAANATMTDTIVPLQWTAVSLLQENEVYAVRLRRLDQNAPVISLFTRTTLVRLDEEYAPSSQEPIREYSWEVTLVRRVGVSDTGEPRYSAASWPSEKRIFRWLYAASQK